MIEMITVGGGWSYLLILGGIVFYCLLILQFIKVKTKNYGPILWGLFGFILILGPLGSLVGFYQACQAVHLANPEVQLPAALKGFGVASLTSTMSLTICALGIIPLKIITARASQVSKE